jgi:signal transduction histidine kinase
MRLESQLLAPEASDEDVLRRRLERQRKARLEAEAISERTTRELYERQRELELLETVAVASNAAGTVEESLQAALTHVCRHAGWPLGHAYLIDRDTRELQPTGVWHESESGRFDAFRTLTEATRFQPGVGLPGRILASGEGAWIADVQIDPDFPRAPAARACGLGGAFGVPILVEATVVGVLEFFGEGPQPRDEGLLHLMGHIGTQVGRVFERSEAEAEARRHREELELLVRERTAALAASNRELEAFSYSVSHDLRAPLRGLDGFSQALLEDFSDALDERGRDYLHRIRAGSQRLGRLIDDMLELARVSRSELRHEPLDLGTIAAEVVNELRQAEPQREVEVTFAAGLEARGDDRLVRVLLANLLSNAWKFSCRRERAHLEVGAETADGETVFFVRDDGAGFDPAYGDKLFTAFQRLHGAEFEGTGIGLATVQRIVHRHGGRVWAEGEIDRGATFHFTLRRAER